MSNKQTFTTEFEFNASPKMIYPYISTVDGLEKWYADSAIITSNNILVLTWDGDEYYVKIQSKKVNSYVMFEFLDDDKEEEDDPNTLRITIDQNEITNSVFLVIEDYSDLVDSQEEFDELWEELVNGLKDLLGA